MELSKSRIWFAYALLSALALAGAAENVLADQNYRISFHLNDVLSEDQQITATAGGIIIERKFEHFDYREPVSRRWLRIRFADRKRKPPGPIPFYVEVPAGLPGRAAVINSLVQVTNEGTGLIGVSAGLFMSCGEEPWAAIEGTASGMNVTRAMHHASYNPSAIIPLPDVECKIGVFPWAYRSTYELGAGVHWDRARISVIVME